MDLKALVTEPAQAESVCDRITLTGALGEARQQALVQVAEANAAISGLTLPDNRKRALDLVAEAVVERYA
jgi:hypothetical protein